MKNISTLSIALIIMSLANMCLAQPMINYDFNDADLSKWSGNSSVFIINPGHQLQLNNTVASSSYLTTTFAPSEPELEWNVYVKLAFAGSANNYGRVYLLSSQENLTSPLNGYYLQLGEAGSNDAVELFRQTATISTSVCRAANGTIASAFAIRLKVTRNSEGLWRLFIDDAEVASGSDATYLTGGWMGFVCVYTAGNANKFFFDDIYAGPAKAEPPPPDVADPFDVVINEFFPDPSPPIGLPEQEFVEIYNRSLKTFNLHGWRIGDASGFISMPSVIIHPDEYVVLTSVPSLNNSGDVIKIVDDHNLVVDSINYTLDWYQDNSKSGGGYSIERLNPDVNSDDITNWYVSLSTTGGTPGTKNSVFGRNPDSKSPVIVNIKYQSDVIIVRFSELVIGNDINGLRTDYRTDSTAVIYLENLTNGSTYTVNLIDITDLAGNVLTPKDFTFTYFIAHKVFHKDIIITEIMADPSPVVQLPEAEYLELYNRSSNPIDLSGWHLEDPTTSAKLPLHILMPNEYIVFTSQTNASKLPKSIGVTSFPSLGNLTDRIVLRDPSGAAIDSVVYNLSWYHSSEKSDGGWSLELIDINNPCGEGGNWTASEDPDGGTPGRVNSVNANKPDVTPPRLLNVVATSADSLVLAFDERPFSVGVSSIAGNASIHDKSIVIVVTEPLNTRTLYSITVSDVQDCSGNVMPSITLTFSLPEPAERNDIIINEVLFNPRPGAADFVEIYNRSNKYISINGWYLSGEKIDTAYVMSPFTYLALTSSIQAIQTSYPSAESLLETSLPSMPDDEGRIDLVNMDLDTIDSFYYNDAMHSAILGDTEGVSLERINPNEDEWHSGNASTGYATPGYVNSNARDVYSADVDKVSIVPEVINPSGVATFSQIFYHFDDGGMVVNASVVDVDGHVIKTIASNETIGREGSFQWSGDRDAGGVARAGYYMVWFQVFDLDGRVKIYRKRVAVGF